NVAANAAEISSALGAAETAGDLVLDLKHAQIAFSLVIVERHAEVMHKRQDRAAMGPQPVEQVARRRLFGPAAFTRRLGGWVSQQPFVAETRVSRFIAGALLGGQCGLSSRLRL